MNASRQLFSALQQSFPRLEALINSGGLPIPPPANLLDIGERVYRTCQGLNKEQLDDVRPSIRRKIPYAMWLDEARDINSEANVTNWYFNHLELVGSERLARSRRSVAPLLHTYIGKFNPDRPHFDRLATHLKLFAERYQNAGLNPLQLASLHKRFDFFNVSKIGPNVAQAFLQGEKPSDDIDSWYESAGLWKGFNQSAAGRHIFRCSLKLNTNLYKSTPTVARLMAWTRKFGGRGISVQESGLLVSALLNPWLREDPPEEFKRTLVNFLLEVVSDPRIDAFRWQQTPDTHKEAFLRWLTGRTLDVFFEVLEHTADSIWKYRQSFWGEYYKKGYIAEAWAVLGPDAHRYIRRQYKDSAAELIYGRLTGQYEDKQSALLLRIGDFLFCEWSHNGKLRAASIADGDCPPLYRKAYEATDLRFSSRPFKSPKTGSYHQDGLPHMSSETNWWQETARVFIRRNVGIKL